MSISLSDFKFAALNNAAIFLERHPQNIVLPTAEEISALEAGDCVKVGVGEGPGSEAFWVEIVALGLLPMVGVIVNELKFTHIHGLAAGDQIMVLAENVFAIHID